MNMRNWSFGLALILLPGPAVWAVTQTEKVHNDKVLTVEQALAPGETITLPADHAGVLVYLGAGSIETTPPQGKPKTETVKRGEAVFLTPRAGELKNHGSTNLRIVRVEYLGNGGSETWGTTGLVSDYKLLFENRYGRVYDIRMATGKSVPLHSQHDRVVICLSGAKLEHEMLDGRKQTSTLKTGEIVWRRGGTHVGHNVGKTDLWVIAIEPK